MKNWAILSLTLGVLLVGAVAEAAYFDGAGDNQTDSHGYYYAMTGGKFPTGNTPNGNNGSGGTFRFLTDDPAWGYAIDVWHKDDWFDENASLALTIKNQGQIVYDNNGIEDGTHGGFYEEATNSNLAGLYRGYSMSNNFDWIYAGYFKLTEETTLDTLIGYFDENAGFDHNSPDIQYHANIWSNVEGDLLPVNTGGFAGDVFSSDHVAGTFAASDTGVDRYYSGWAGLTDDIFRLTYTLDSPITLEAGEYWFSHDASIVPEPTSLAIWGLLGVGCAGGAVVRRRRRRAAPAPWSEENRQAIRGIVDRGRLGN